MIWDHPRRHSGQEHPSSLTNYSYFHLDHSVHSETECLGEKKSVLVFFPLPLELASHFVWKCRCLSSKPENKQLAASSTSLSQQLGFLEGVLAIDAEIVLGGVPCLSSPESLHFISCLSYGYVSAAPLEIPSPLTHRCLVPLGSRSFLFLPIFIFVFYVFTFAGVASFSVVSAHPISPLSCRCQQTSTCLQMRRSKTVREEERQVFQQL